MGEALLIKYASFRTLLPVPTVLPVLNRGKSKLRPPDLESLSQNRQQIVGLYFGDWLSDLEKLFNEEDLYILSFVDVLHATFYQDETLADSENARPQLVCYVEPSLQFSDVLQQLFSEVEHEKKPATFKTFQFELGSLSAGILADQVFEYFDEQMRSAKVNYRAQESKQSLEITKKFEILLSHTNVLFWMSPLGRISRQTF